jgi:hypothetical protein
MKAQGIVPEPWKVGDIFSAGNNPHAKTVEHMKRTSLAKRREPRRVPIDRNEDFAS